jgi:hypothetical protein
VQQSEHVVDILFDQRTVQSKLFPNLLDRFIISLRSGNNARRVAGRHLQHHKNQQ